MSDYYSTPVIDQPNEPLPPPGSYEGASDASEPSAGSREVIQSIKDKAFEAIANDDSGDATDYANERKDQIAEESGETLSPQRQRDRQGRYQRALEAARSADDSDDGERGQSRQPNQEGPQSQEEANNWHEAADSIRATAQHEIRAAAFERAVPDYKDTIQSVFSVFPLNEHVAAALIRSEHGPEITYRLANGPVDTIDAVNAMTPEQFRLDLARAEGMLNERQRMAQQPLPSPRRATRAPPPLSTVRGGTSGNFDPNDASMDEYVAKRRGGWNG